MRRFSRALLLLLATPFLAAQGERLPTPDALRDTGQLENTLIIFTSDNGPETTSVIRMRADYGHDGARPWRGMKRWINAPLI